MAESPEEYQHRRAAIEAAIRAQSAKGASDPAETLRQLGGASAEPSPSPKSDNDIEHYLPKTWGEMWPLLVWGFLVLALCFVLVDSLAELFRDPVLRAISAAIAMVALIAMVIHRSWLTSKFKSASGSAVLLAIVAGLLVLALSPFIEQRRLPFAWQFQEEPGPASRGHTPTQNTTGPTLAEFREIQGKWFETQQELKQTTGERDAERRNLADAKRQLANAVTSLPKSPILGLDDARRWQVLVSLEQQQPRSEFSACKAVVYSEPKERPSATANEVTPILSYAGWSIQGPGVPRTYFPPGITLLVGAEGGPAYNCAFTLSQILQGGLGAKIVTFKSGQSTPSLVSCHNECMEIVFGDEPGH